MTKAGRWKRFWDDFRSTTEWGREIKIRHELYALLDQLEEYRCLQATWPHINDLIADVNARYWLLDGQTDTIPLEPW
jgi:hypothetical protein